MVRWRSACVTLFLAVAIALCAAPAAYAGGAAPASVTASPALTWRTLWQTTLGAHSAAAVVNSRQDAWELFTQPSGTGWAIAGRHVFAGGAAGAPLVLVDGLGDVGALVAQRDRHDGFVLVWKSGSTIWAQRFDSGGAPRFAAQPLVSDGEAATAGGVPSATATVTAVAADSSGGFYIGVAVSAASRSFGLIEYVSATGTPRLAPPGKVVSSAVAALAADSADHVFALLQSTTVAVQRYSAALVPDWPAVRLSAAGATALSLNATSPATALWSQGGRCWLQRLSAAGKRILRVPTVMSGGGHDVSSVADGAGGTWVTDAVARGLRLRHVDAVGRFVTGGASGTIVPLALTAPTVGHPQSNRAGDLFVSYTGTKSGLLRAGVARVTFTGATTRVALAGTASQPPLVATDGAGGAFAVWQATGHATIARLGFAGRSLTCEPTAAVLRYGSRVTISGYALSGRYVATGVRVTIRRKTGAGSWVTVAGATTSAEGYYAVSVAPRSNSRWMAVAVLARHSTASPIVSIGVRVRISIAVTRVSAGALISGRVAPPHAGATVSLQRLTGGRWKTIAHLRLDRRSAYAYLWRLPRRNVTAQFRIAFATHTDNLGNVSPTATVSFRFSTGAITARMLLPAR